MVIRAEDVVLTLNAEDGNDVGRVIGEKRNDLCRPDAVNRDIQRVRAATLHAAVRFFGIHRLCPTEVAGEMATMLVDIESDNFLDPDSPVSYTHLRAHET